MNIHPNTTPASPSLASLHFDASFDSVESFTTSCATSVVLTLEFTTVTQVALGYHRNQQYSITAMTTSTGAIAERNAYTAYGQPTICDASGFSIGNQQSQIANRFTYTGREWDATLGLHHFGARWMSPLAGRFLGRDSIGYEGSELLLYECLEGNTQNSLDYSWLRKIPLPNAIRRNCSICFFNWTGNVEFEINDFSEDCEANFPAEAECYLYFYVVDMGNPNNILYVSPRWRNPHRLLDDTVVHKRPVDMSYCECGMLNEYESLEPRPYPQPNPICTAKSVCWTNPIP